MKKSLDLIIALVSVSVNHSDAATNNYMDMYNNHWQRLNDSKISNALPSVRQEYCPSSARKWGTSSKGAILWCSGDYQENNILVDWEGNIFFVHWDAWSGKKTYRFLGEIKDIK